MAKISKALAKKLLQRHLANSFKPEDLFDLNFPQQVNFIKDPSSLKALFCTRRAAKSYTAGMYLLYEAFLHPGKNFLFLGLTRASAKGIIWKDILREMNKKFNLNARFNSTELTMTLPNGSVIYITGADADEEEMNKLLGRKYRLVTIDEASMYTIDMAKLVYGILKPAIADSNGTICLMGTASNFTRGLFYDITTNNEPGWKLFTWTALDNPHIRVQWQQELDEIDQKREFFKETPMYRQWYLNQWAIDNDARVYKFNPDRNLYTTLPSLPSPQDWTFILGTDLGWEDDNALVLTAYHPGDPNLYIIRTFNQNHLRFDELVDKIRIDFMSDPVMMPSKVIIDGANKQGVESMRHRGGIPFEYADKQGKEDFIELLNSDLIQGKIKVHISCKNLIDELSTLLWQTDGDKLKYPKKEHPGFSNHLCDAFLYAWRCGYHFAFQEQIPKPIYGSQEWGRQQEEAMVQHTYQEIRKEQDTINNNQTNWLVQDTNDTWTDLSKWKKN